MNSNTRAEIARTITVVLLSLFVVLSVSVGVSTAKFVDSGNPDPEAYVPEPTLEPGTTTTLSVQIANDAQVNTGAPANRDRVTMARNVVVELDVGDAPITINTPRHSIGSVSENEPRLVPFEVDIPENAEPGTYEATVNIRYSYTKALARDVEQELSDTRTETVTFEISDDPQFKLTRTDDSQLRADETSLFNLTVENTGGETARDVAVSLSSQSSAIMFSGGQSDVARIDSLAPDETTQVTYEAAVKPDAPARLYELTGAATYVDSQGIDGRDDDLSVGVEVAPRRDDFGVSMTESTIGVGASRLVEVEVTNNRDQRLTDIEASLGTNDPLDSDDDDGYIESLDPGESATVTFELSATGDANPKTYAATVDFRYDDQRGISRMSEPYQLPVDVQADDGTPLQSVIPFAGIGLLLVTGIVGYARWRPDSVPWN